VQESGTREGLRVCRKCYKRVQESATREGLRSVQEVLQGLRSMQEVLQESAGECRRVVQEECRRVQEVLQGLRSVQEVLRGLRALHTVRLHSQAAALLCQLLI